MLSCKRDTEALSSSTSRTHTPSMKADSTSGTIAAVAASSVPLLTAGSS